MLIDKSGKLILVKGLNEHRYVTKDGKWIHQVTVWDERRGEVVWVDVPKVISSPDEGETNND